MVGGRTWAPPPRSPPCSSPPRRRMLRLWPSDALCARAQIERALRRAHDSTSRRRGMAGALHQSRHHSKVTAESYHRGLLDMFVYHGIENPVSGRMETDQAASMTRFLCAALAPLSLRSRSPAMSAQSETHDSRQPAEPRTLGKRLLNPTPPALPC